MRSRVSQATLGTQSPSFPPTRASLDSTARIISREIPRTISFKIGQLISERMDDRSRFCCFGICKSKKENESDDPYWKTSVGTLTSNNVNADKGEEIVKPSSTGEGSSAAEGNPRNKVALLPGHSLMDWIRLGNSGKDLTSVGGRLQSVTEQQLAEHRENGNAWLVIRGKVYNIAPYLNFHPGGVEELMKGAGKDATTLFAEVHPWVNYESILQKCLVGRLVKSSAATQEDLAKAFFDLAPPTNEPTENPLTMTWTQTTQTITFQISSHMSSPQVVIRQTSPQAVRILVRVRKKSQVFHFRPHSDLHWPCALAVENGKISVLFRKEVDKCWGTYGTDCEDHGKTLEDASEMDVYYRAKIEAVALVTHNVKIIKIRFVDKVGVWIPIGHDVRIKAVIEGVETARRYTPISQGLFQVTPTITRPDSDCLTFAVKCYPSGALTPTLFAKTAGDEVELGGIAGLFDIDELQGTEHLYLIAAGTGFTPMTRLVDWALSKKHTIKTINLLFLNRCERDIIWRKELDQLAQKEPALKVHYVLSSPENGWNGWKGRLDDAMLTKFIPQSQNESKAFVCVCGPQEFTLMVQKLLDCKGWKSRYHCFLG